MSEDVAVVGAGIVGLSAAFELVRRGAAVTVYDASPPGSGQSAGQSRVFRHAHDDPRLVELAVQSRRIWREWQEDLGTELVSDDGALALGPPAESRLEILDRVPDVHARRLAADELPDRLPLLASYDGPAVLDESAGSIRTRATIGALTDRLAGAIVQEDVIALRPTGRGTVELRAGTVRSEHAHVLVCAGRGTTALARGVGVEIPLRHEAHVRVTFAVKSDPPPRVAALLDSSGVFGEVGVYAASYPGNTHYAVGLAESIDVTDERGPERLANSADRAAAYVARALPGLDPEPVGYVHCWNTTLPWGEDAFSVWEEAGVSFVAGNNLFKHAPAVGRALAGCAVGDPLPKRFKPEARLGDAQRWTPAGATT